MTDKRWTKMIIRALQSTLLLVVFGSAIAFGQTSTATAANQILLTVEGEVATRSSLRLRAEH